MTSTSRTARCGPACRVVWEGPDRQRSALNANARTGKAVAGAAERAAVPIAPTRGEVRDMDAGRACRRRRHRCPGAKRQRRDSSWPRATAGPQGSQEGDRCPHGAQRHDATGYKRLRDERTRRIRGIDAQAHGAPHTCLAAGPGGQHAGGACRAGAQPRAARPRRPPCIDAARLAGARMHR